MILPRESGARRPPWVAPIGAQSREDRRRAPGCMGEKTECLWRDLVDCVPRYCPGAEACCLVRDWHPADSLGGITAVEDHRWVSGKGWVGPEIDQGASRAPKRKPRRPRDPRRRRRD